MEEARPSFRRHLTIDFVPERTSCEILALAFGWLTAGEKTSSRAPSDSVQTVLKQSPSEARSYQEMTR